MRYILDTYAWIEYFRGSEKGKKVSRIMGNTLFTLENCIAELRIWCLEEGIDFKRILDIIRECSSIEPINVNNWVEAAEIRQEQRKTQNNFGLMDAIILAKQKEIKGRIVTGDRHFQNLKDVLFI
ncbi:MAG: PIN domain-containing protein [archaeon]